MPKTSTLDEKLAVAVDISAQRDETYTDLARLAATGQEPEENLLVDVLARAHKTPNDFRVLVGILKQRQELRVKLGAITAKEVRRDSLQKSIDEQNAQLEQVLIDHRHKVAGWHVELVQLNSEIAEGSILPNQLQKSCPCPKLNARFRELQDMAARIRNFDELEARSHLDRVKSITPESPEHASSLAASMAAAEAAYKKVRQQMTQNTNEINEVHQAMIDF